ncbi:hypothetical protein [Virgibacillus halodenitrificans]|uniref:hypothetical protein n=1 Tax=Virgibacillus halodenitrificans TaxID=1482 RepID=UPI002DB58B72|nr:hypothetical protein [Virgibacillus halodenitrificans]MEC2159583.1 hypothetical protein [Virgibacillus halodenitrificans]
MIRDLWRNSLKEKSVTPNLLTNCSLYVEMECYPIDITYAFLDIEWTTKLIKIGDEWVYHTQTYKKRKGFFSSNMKIPSISNNDVVSLFGYTPRKRFQLLDVRILGPCFNNGVLTAASFEFSSYRMKHRYY